jgi:hypothetical protein
MSTPLLTTKLHIPPVRPELVPRPRLIERLNAGLDRKLTLVSAPAGYGKTTLLGPALMEAGIHVLAFNYRGTWESEGGQPGPPRASLVLRGRRVSTTLPRCPKRRGRDSVR